MPKDKSKSSKDFWAPQRLSESQQELSKVNPPDTQGTQTRVKGTLDAEQGKLIERRKVRYINGPLKE